jgi:acylphosphatase
MTGARVRRRVRVRGRVQGVFFRDSARRQAERRGVAGWASNEPDGTVMLVLEGEREGVERMLDFCRTGPEAAHVEEVEESEEEPEGLEGFVVR